MVKREQPPSHARSTTSRAPSKAGRPHTGRTQVEVDGEVFDGHGAAVAQAVMHGQVRCELGDDDANSVAASSFWEDDSGLQGIPPKVSW